MNLFWGVYWAIAVGVAVWQWRRSGSLDQSGIDRLWDAILLGLFWWLYLLVIAAFEACSWFDDKFAGGK